MSERSEADSFKLQYHTHTLTSKIKTSFTPSENHTTILLGKRLISAQSLTSIHVILSIIYVFMDFKHNNITKYENIT